MEALCVTEKILTIGRAPENLVKKKPDCRLGAKPACHPSRDLRLALLPQRGNELKAGGRKADDLSSVQLG